jgi:sporulation protein YlmC with PRC-barrel domain
MPTGDQTPRPAQAPEISTERSERFRIGAHVRATDGECGELERVIVDPVMQALTHLVVAPKHHRGLGRLVPVELVEAVDGDQIRLRCNVARFRELDDAEDIQFLPGDTGVLGYGPDAMTWPYYGLGMPLTGAHDAEREPILMDRVPLGEVEVRRGDQVHASDGWIGSVQGLVIDPRDNHVTHVLLEEGHFWGHKQVAIPIGATSRVDEEIRVALTKQEVMELPPVELRSRP